MSSQELLRGIFAFVFGATLAWGLYRRYDPLMQDEDSLKPYKHWAPILAPCLLPVFLTVLLAEILIIDIEDTLPLFGTMCAGIFIHMSIYFALLIALSPLLRKWINARTCAALWLLPNLLYICEANYMQRSTPKWVIRLNGSWLRWAVVIWLAGFAGILIWKLAEHFAFRKTLREAAWPERSPETDKVWTDMQTSAKIKRARIPLLRSEKINSPLSVGLSPASTFVVLPDRDYEPEEIALILRHELIHIVRRDAQTKFLLTLCTAICWFNPLMWIAAKRCAEDLELSCDELVLEDTGEEEKKRYADLILSSAGESKGFTSSLAPKAESLRYRLRQIMTPGKRLTGGIIAGLVLFLLLISSGLTAFAYGSGTAGELIWNNDVPAITNKTTIDLGTRDQYGEMELHPYICTDQDALMDYIGGLKVCRLCGNYNMNTESKFLEMFLPGENGPRILFLEDKCLKITDLGSRQMYTELWYLDHAPDWDLVETLLEPQAEKVQMSPPQPFNMEIVFGPDSVIDGDVFTAAGKILENTLDGEPSVFYNGWQPANCAVEGIPVEWAEISFPSAPEEGSAVVSVRAWDMDMTNSRDVSWDENGRMTLLPYSARYIVQTRWEFGTDLGIQVYRMEYEFDVIIY